MSILRVYRDDTDPQRCEEYTTFEDIVRVAAEAAIRFERWTADRELPEGASPEEVLGVIALSPDQPNHPEMRKKFLSEHTHAEDEARFFVDGSGLFSIHHGHRVYALLCEKGDLINVPAGTRHWFDMGPAPRFKCIRLFNDPKGWVAEFTGSDVADRFPRFGA
jgi:1,2-dihydroxy-3-keto-5-methylthiopentene dioxygenase